MLEPSRIDDEADEDIENIEDMVSFGAIMEAFCVGENDVIDEAIQNKWNAIQKIFRERSLQIMPRNLKMVKNQMNHSQLLCANGKRTWNAV